MRRTHIVLASVGVFVALLMIASSAFAGSLVIDKFRDAPAPVYIYPMVNPGPWSSTQSDSEIMGNERELSVTPAGPPTPPPMSTKVVSSVGIDDEFGDGTGPAPDGALQVGTQDAYSARVALMYDGPASEGLGGVDITGGGTNDRLMFSFISVAAVGSLDATIILTDTDGNQVQRDTSFADNGDPHSRSVPFSDFSGDPGMSFASIDSMEVLLNDAGEPNSDFSLSSIELVPEPTSWSLMLIGTLAFAAYRNRRRNRMAGNP